MKAPAKSDQQITGVNGVTQILVVDDDTCMFDVFPHLLPPPRYEITNAAHGRQALQLATKHPFDIAFVDYYMGDMDGVEISRMLRTLLPDIKIVLMSGYLMHERVAAIEKAGAQAFLTKPFSAETARALAERLVGNKEPDATVALSGKKAAPTNTP